MEITILGSGGWFPSKERETASALVRHGSQALLLDAGSGLRHLVERPELLAGTTEIDIVLSHFHLDHTVGLSFLPVLGGNPRPRIWGPGSWLYEEPTDQLLRHVYTMPQSAFNLDLIGDAFDFNPDGQSFGGIELRFREQKLHTHPTVGFRCENRFAYCTDTGYDEGTIDFASGVELLFHEAWSFAHDPQHEDKHSTAAQAGQLAREASVGRLELIHLNPVITDQEAIRAEAADAAGDSVAVALATDTLTIPLG